MRSDIQVVTYCVCSKTLPNHNKLNLKNPDNFKKENKIINLTIYVSLIIVSSTCAASQYISNTVPNEAVVSIINFN